MYYNSVYMYNSTACMCVYYYTKMYIIFSCTELGDGGVRFHTSLQVTEPAIIGGKLVPFLLGTELQHGIEALWLQSTELGYALGLFHAQALCV